MLSGSAQTRMTPGLAILGRSCATTGWLDQVAARQRAAAHPRKRAGDIGDDPLSEGTPTGEGSRATGPRDENGAGANSCPAPSLTALIYLRQRPRWTTLSLAGVNRLT